MKASLLDLRRQTNKVVEAIDKNQQVTLTRRGKTFAVISPVVSKNTVVSAKNHPAYGMYGKPKGKADVLDGLNRIRSNRYAL